MRRDKHLQCWIVLGLVALHACAPSRLPVGEFEEVIPQKAEDVQEIVESKEDWVERTLARLTLPEKAAQLLAPRAFGFYMSEESDEWKRLEQLVVERKVGGFVVFQGDVYATAVLMNRLQGLSDVPLLISADFERGVAMRIRRGTPFPEAMAVAATRNTALAFRVGKIIAKEGRALGVHQNYAPVVDVNNNPANPVINIRSFGEDPSWVAEMGVAFASGLQEGGMIATAKHFPGHGDTEVDSHIGLPVLRLSRTHLDTVELPPFRALIDRGVMSVMIAHVAVPALDPSPGLPASLSKRIISGMLKEEFGFQGLVVADAFDMRALSANFGVAEAAVRSIDAGMDLIIVPPVASEGDIIDAIVYAVRIGRISEERLDYSVRKILSIKHWLALHERRTVDVAAISRELGTPEHWHTAKTVARESITILRNDNVLPLQRFGRRSRILNVIVADTDDYRTEIHRGTSPWPNERVGSYFTSLLRRRHMNVETVRLDPRSNRLEFDSILVRGRHADIIIIPVFVKARSGSGRFGLPQPLIDFVNLLSVQGKPTIFIAMGSPYVLGALKNGRAYICAYSDGELSTEAVVEAMFGEIPAGGKLPVTIPGFAPLGTGLEIAQSTLRGDIPSAVDFDARALAELDTVMLNAIADSAFPGGQLLVVRKGVVVHNKSYGKLTYSPESPSVTSNTIYDIASLTKVVATTAAVMRLCDEGSIDLDTPAAHYLPEFRGHGKERITIRNLLLHDSGLPAYQRLHLTSATAEEALDSIYNSRLLRQPGDSTIYSDFGMIVLAKVIERITGQRLDHYVTQKFLEPLGMSQTMFNPPPALRTSIAPTEYDSVWRKALIIGSVHDENAALLGGVAGHAGLFSSASDLALFMQMIMNGGSYGGVEFLRPETVQLFTSRQGSRGRRGLGWDMKSTEGYSSAGSLFSNNSFGHLGFTGTSIWADPERDVFVILLTNRVHPTSTNTKIRKIRPVIHDIVSRAIIESKDAGGRSHTQGGDSSRYSFN